MYATADFTKLADAQNLADRLMGLPEKALIYIAGYAEGRRDGQEDDMPMGDRPPVKPPTNRPA